MRATTFLALLAGCGGGGAHPADLSPPADLAPANLNIAATDGTLSLKNADFSLAGSGSSRLGTLSITHGAGQVEIDGRSIAAAVYQRQTFPDLLLYQTLAVEKDRVWVLWFYCSTVDQTLNQVYYESTDGDGVVSESASGNCVDANMTSTVSVQFPALDLPRPPLLPGFTISGAKIQLDGAAPGTVDLGGGPLTVLAFNTVDCTKICGSPGWTELHALLWDEAGARVCFAIIYLRSEDTAHVQLAYSLTLPDLSDPAENVVLPASWTLP